MANTAGLVSELHKPGIGDAGVGDNFLNGVVAH